MEIPITVTNEYRNLLNPVYQDAENSIQALLAETSDLSLAKRQEAFHDVLPLVGDASSDAVSQISAVFFDQLMQIQDVRRPPAGDILEQIDPKVWHSLIGWAFSDGSDGRSVLERGGEALLYSLLSGGLSRVLAQTGADTMIGNAQNMDEVGNAQRVPQPGCCSFCGMLASRFAEYTSAKSAGKVGGRGMPVEATIIGYKENGDPIRKQGGQARGIRTRGSRAIGEDYHDDCRCSIVIVTEGNYAQLQADADKYYDAYRDAADKVNEGLSLKTTTTKLPDGTRKNKYEWVKADGESTTPKSRTNDIVNSMRRELNTD